MGVLDILPWRSSDTEEERPPKPDGYSGTDTKEFDRSKILLEYNNGETESFETHQYRFRDDRLIIGECEPRVMARYSNTLNFRDVRCRMGSKNRVIVPYETLSQRPMVEGSGTTAVTYSYRVGYEWKERIRRKSQWRETLEEWDIEDMTEVSE